MIPNPSASWSRWPAPADITSPRNPKVVAARRLHDAKERRKTGSTLLEGPHLLDEAVSAGGPVRTVFALPDDLASIALAEAAGAEMITVSQPVLDRLAPTQHPRGPLAIMESPTSVTVDTRHVLVLWGISDPGNAGTIIRTAAALGLGVIGVATTDLWAPKVLRAAAGGHFRTQVEVTPELSVSDLNARSYLPLATLVSGGVPPWELPDGRYAILIGEEARGLPPEVVEQCPVRVTIPMLGATQSLNAAAAVAILCYELTTRNPRGCSDPPG